MKPSKEKIQKRMKEVGNEISTKWGFKKSNAMSKAIEKKKSPSKYERKAMRKLGKITDGGGKPYTLAQIVSNLKAETKHHKTMKEYRQHEGFDN